MIFISHRTSDQNRAIAIKDYLKSTYSIDSFYAPYKPLNTFKLDIASWIVGELNLCSHLIAVFSEKTVGSMWVPFELGAAYQAKKKIGAYVFDDPNIPSYLNAFPIMRFEEQLDEYAKLYLGHKKIHKSLTESIKNASVSGADNFITTLKSRLGQ